MSPRNASSSAQLVLAPRGDLALELDLVRPAELGLARPGGQAIGGPASGGEGRQDERPGDPDDGQAQKLRVVGEEHREGRRDGQREAAGLEQRSPLDDDGARSDVVLAQRHGPSVAAEDVALTERIGLVTELSPTPAGRVTR
jgi:hypothetical protein